MNNIPEELLYSKTHEWFKLDSDIVTMGITDFAQSELSEIVYVGLPEVGQQLAPEDECGVIEAVKTVESVLLPFAGEVLEVNESLEHDAEQVNTDPYGKGWFIKVRVADVNELKDLLDAQEYAQWLGEK